MFSIKSFFAKLTTKKKFRDLYIIDGDNCGKDTWVYDPVLGSAEVVYVAWLGGDCAQPKVVKSRPELQYTGLRGFRAGKEIADKYIAVLLQKAISSGYTNINIVSRDADMIDIARMVMIANTFDVKTNINIIMPNLGKVPLGVDFSDIVGKNVTMKIFRVKQKK